MDMLGSFFTTSILLARFKKNYYNANKRLSKLNKENENILLKLEKLINLKLLFATIHLEKRV